MAVRCIHMTYDYGLLWLLVLNIFLVFRWFKRLLCGRLPRDPVQICKLMKAVCFFQPYCTRTLTAWSVSQTNNYPAFTAVCYLASYFSIMSSQLYFQKSLKSVFAVPAWGRLWLWFVQELNVFIVLLTNLKNNSLFSLRQQKRDLTFLVKPLNTHRPWHSNISAWGNPSFICDLAGEYILQSIKKTQNRFVVTVQRQILLPL